MTCYEFLCPSSHVLVPCGLPRVSDKNNRYVYITGCDSGFGNLLAQHLDKQGFRVIASCFTERGEEDLKKSCSSNLITTHLDVRSQDSIAKVEEMVIDVRRQRGDHAPLYINRVCVERVVFFKLLGTHISEDLTWTGNTAALVKKAQQRLHFLRVLWRNHLEEKLQVSFYRTTIEPVLMYYVSVWFAACSVADRRALHRVTRTAEKIIPCPAWRTLPALDTLAEQRKSWQTTLTLVNNCSTCCHQRRDSGLWAVVNNAGVSIPSAQCDWLTLDDYKSMLDVNLNGVIPSRGRVVNVASVFGRISAIGGPYTVSKFGVEAFSDSIRINMAPFGVKVLCIEPGFFKTQMTSSEVVCNNIKMVWEKLPQEVRADYGSEYLQKALALLTDKIAKLGDADLMKVAATAAVRPRTHYSPGWDAKLFRLPLSYMPNCVSDYILQMEAIPIAKQIE
ncbi:retinol dehydrogenase 16-like [Archocentrus centrarchus]|uniref:retinol dehydrogenase 16-like n=1 Tax=Archocentrus centrarchus TaxID=63155 RepID=UPI0011E9B8B5|nr:retinol dehydrogenase 16-like [Archocentrus centrarchus]